MSNSIKKYALAILGLMIGNAYAVDFSKTEESNKYYEYKNHSETAKGNNVISYFVGDAEVIKNVVNEEKLSKGNSGKSIIKGGESCWDSAGKKYGVDPWLLFAYASVESNFNATAINKANRNKTKDIGMMQINSSWLPTLKKYKISENDLYSPCVSIYVGAWIASQNIKQHGYNEDGIGAYNSPFNKTIRRAYAKKVIVSYNKLVGRYYGKNDFVLHANLKKYAYD